MKRKDADVIKVLIDMGMRVPEELSEEEEKTLRYATDEEYRYYEDIKKLFADDSGEK